FTPPPGFGGVNNLWLQANNVTVRLGYDLANAEFNYRYADPYCRHIDWLIGLRWFDLTERFAIETNADVNDPLQHATDRVRAHNRIACGQVGFEAILPLMPNFVIGTWSKNGV